MTGGLVAVAEPRLAISGFMTRTEIWLLAVFIEGVLALLGGLAGWIGVWAGSRGVRDVARDAESAAGAGEAPAGFDGFPSVTVVGVCLLTIYAVGWLATLG